MAFQPISSFEEVVKKLEFEKNIQQNQFQPSHFQQIHLQPNPIHQNRHVYNPFASDPYSNPFPNPSDVDFNPMQYASIPNPQNVYHRHPQNYCNGCAAKFNRSLSRFCCVRCQFYFCGSCTFSLQLS